MAWRRLLAVLALVVASLGFAAAQDAPARRVLLAEIDGVIGPATSHYVAQAVEEADATGAEALVLQINTPGGLATSMRDIIETILASRTPVIGYVAPSGGHAASAGTFILYATHIAAMAPGTNIGAASPVDISGGGPLPGPQPETDEEKEKAKASASDAMTAKVTNDAVALIRGLAEMRGRNADWAEAAVREAAAVSAEEARRLNVIELVADDIDQLLTELDGREVTIDRAPRILRLEGARLERVEPSVITRALAVIANPNVALLLMMIGIYGIIYEFLSPGTIGPGVIGAICLILGLYALNQLPLNYAGLALIALGVALMAAESFSPSFGILGIGGIIAFAIGAFMLVDTDIPAFRVSPIAIAATTGLSALFLLIVVGYAFRAHRRPAMAAVGALIGQSARVLDWSDGAGHVWAQGERWRAVGEGSFSAGDAVRIVGRDALTVRIARDSKEPPS